MTGNSHLNENTGNPGKQSPTPKTRVLKQREKIARELQDKFFGGNYEVDVKELADFVVQKLHDGWSEHVRTGIAIGRRETLAMMQDVIGSDEKQIWDAEFGHCERCDFQPTDNTQNCICIYHNDLRATQRKRLDAAIQAVQEGK